ncbi:uncharacterized protein LOC119327562 isoform X1 [Triticum dicoccoides]|uniref:uncharacterized protein LOC119327562 isoform X1 n=1 Tax=Triticum dicoccoides TaxID=85692 RepID=UPI001891E884|nr:uncharacterized protein LOC119327562 isoform X1 [Triticum dicoccoides]
MSLRIGKNPIFPLRLFDLQRSCSVCGGDYQYGATELLLPVACTGLLLLVVRSDYDVATAHAAAAAGWWRRAPTCSSIRSRTPPPSTPTSRHMMCTLGRPVRRTANETTPNVMSVLTFCNQATALLRSPPAAAKGFCSPLLLNLNWRVETSFKF